MNVVNLANADYQLPITANAYTDAMTIVSWIIICTHLYVSANDIRNQCFTGNVASTNVLSLKHMNNIDKTMISTATATMHMIAA